MTDRPADGILARMSPMNTRHRYDPDCPHCRPVIFHQLTGQVLPDDSPEMQVVNAIWDSSPFAQREAFINVTVHNSSDVTDVTLATALTDRLRIAVNEVDG